MPGSDMVLFEAAKSDIVIDAHVLDVLLPVVDDCSQDWQLLSSQTNDGFLIFEVSRLLDTGDLQDRVIVDDSSPSIIPHRIISAWGDTPTVQQHSPTSRVKSSVRFFGDSSQDELQLFRDTMEVSSEGSFTVQADSYPIKTVETEYVYFCASLADLQSQNVPTDTALHIVGVEPVVDKAIHVHHFILYGRDRDLAPTESCSDQSYEVLYAWAPGAMPLTLPSNVGGLVGTSSAGGIVSFQLEIHYDNSLQIPNVVDSSGVRLYYTTQLREHDLGVLELGDPLVQLGGRPVNSGGGSVSKHVFDCPSSCSTNFVNPSEPVTVVRQFLHMHTTGTRIVNEHIRDDEVIGTAAIDLWDFDSQGAPAVRQEPFQILAGDSFRTTCYYQANDSTRFGLASSDEMCIAFLFYYPRLIRQTFFGSIPYGCGYDIGLPRCNSDWQEESVAGANRTFGRAECAATDSPPTETPPPTVSETLVPGPVPTEDSSLGSIVSDVRSLSIAVVIALLAFN